MKFQIADIIELDQNRYSVEAIDGKLILIKCVHLNDPEADLPEISDEIFDVGDEYWVDVDDLQNATIAQREVFEIGDFIESPEGNKFYLVSRVWDDEIFKYYAFDLQRAKYYPLSNVVGFKKSSYQPLEWKVGDVLVDEHGNEFKVEESVTQFGITQPFVRCTKCVLPVPVDLHNMLAEGTGILLDRFSEFGVSLYDLRVL